MIPTVAVTRYVTPLREGGSLPGLLEASDLGTYVVKFRSAGQGRKALVAEVIAGELARRLGLPVPELVAIELPAAIAPGEPDQEIQELLKASAGLNLGMDYLPGSLGYDPLAFPVGIIARQSRRTAPKSPRWGVPRPGRISVRPMVR